MQTTADFGERLCAQTDALAGRVETALNAVAEVIADVCETPGNALLDGLSGIARRSRHAHAVTQWLGGIFAGVLDLGGAVVKGVVGIGAGVLAGAVRIVGGGVGAALTGRSGLLERGARDVLSGAGGALVVTVGKLVALVQSVAAVQAPRRPLTADESDMLERVFRGSVALYNVRIVEGRSGLFGVNKRPFTLGNTLYMKAISSETNPSVLVHECAHAWQYQNVGARYAADALAAQAFIHDPYNWRLELERGRGGWLRFNKEAQAELLRDAYRSGSRDGKRPAGKGEFYEDEPIGDGVRLVLDGRDHTTLAREAVATVRRRRAARLSRGLLRRRERP